MADPSCELFDELSALAAAGAATPEEAEALEHHLAAGCAACAAVLPDYREAVARLAEGLPPQAPPPHVRAQLLDAVARELSIAPGQAAVLPFPARTGRVRSVAAGWVLAAAMALLFFGSFFLQRQTVQDYAHQVEVLRRELATRQADWGLVSARPTHTVRLQGQAPSPLTSGRVFWNPETHTGFLVVFDLPALPPGRVYQLWAIPGGESARPIGAGTFTRDAEGKGMLRLSPLPDARRPVQIFAITEEPAGGSPQPTTTPFILGSL